MVQISTHSLLAVAATDSETARTLTVNVNQAKKAIVNLNMTARSSATKLEAILKRSVDGGATYAKITTVAISGGTGAISDYDPEKTLAEAGVDPLPSMSLDVDVEAATHLQVIAVITDGDANDIADMKVGASVWS